MLTTFAKGNTIRSDLVLQKTLGNDSVIHTTFKSAVLRHSRAATENKKQDNIAGSKCNKTTRIESIALISLIEE